jgi:hypothetical protein
MVKQVSSVLIGFGLGLLTAAHYVDTALASVLGVASAGIGAALKLLLSNRKQTVKYGKGSLE